MQKENIIKLACSSILEPRPALLRSASLKNCDYHDDGGLHQSQALDLLRPLQREHHPSGLPLFILQQTASFLKCILSPPSHLISRQNLRSYSKTYPASNLSRILLLLFQGQSTSYLAPTRSIISSARRAPPAHPYALLLPNSDGSSLVRRPSNHRPHPLRPPFALPLLLKMLLRSPPLCLLYRLDIIVFVTRPWPQRLVPSQLFLTAQTIVRQWSFFRSR